MGLRLLELTCFREKIVKRETKIVAMLSFIHSWIWKALFGRSADSLEKSTEHDDEYMIIDNKFVFLFLLFCFILFYFILFSFIFFYFILFYFILFYFVFIKNKCINQLNKIIQNLILKYQF